MEEQLRELAAIPAVRAATIVAGSMVAAVVIEWLVRRILGSLARRTSNQLDDMLVESLRRPVFISVVLVGLAWAATELPLVPAVIEINDSVLMTIAVLIWSSAAFRIGTGTVEALGRRGSGSSIVQARTIPMRGWRRPVSSASRSASQPRTHSRTCSRASSSSRTRPTRWATTSFSTRACAGESPRSASVRLEC